MRPSVLIGVVLGACVSGAVMLAQQPPTFRAGVDLIALDIGVVDRDGHPVEGLVPKDFEVSIGGKKREVVSADVIRVATSLPAGDAVTQNAATPATAEPPASGAGPSSAPSTSGSRLIVLAIDGLSFAPAEVRPFVLAAKSLIQQLGATDRLGLFAYPLGPKVNPTTDHAVIVKALDQISGQREGDVSQYQLRPYEMVDVAAAPDVCGPTPPPPSVETIMTKLCGKDCPCRENARNETLGKAQLVEMSASKSFSNLEALMHSLGAAPGRKIVVLVSAGFPSSGRPGVHPDLTNWTAQAGQAAATSGVTLYTLFVDRSFIALNVAENRQAPVTLTNLSQDAAVLEQGLDETTDAAGGTVLKILAGNGEYAFKRIASETAQYYVLGVAPADADRDGKPRELRIKVLKKGATVRGRHWVVVPAR